MLFLWLLPGIYAFVISIVEIITGTHDDKRRYLTSSMVYLIAFLSFIPLIFYFDSKSASVQMHYGSSYVFGNAVIVLVNACVKAVVQVYEKKRLTS